MENEVRPDYMFRSGLLPCREPESHPVSVIFESLANQQLPAALPGRWRIPASLRLARRKACRAR